MTLRKVLGMFLGGRGVLAMPVSIRVMLSAYGADLQPGGLGRRLRPVVSRRGTYRGRGDGQGCEEDEEQRGEAACRPSAQGWGESGVPHAVTSRRRWA